MRVVQNIQMKIGEVDISGIVFDLKSRDDIPQILRGLQHLYQDQSLRGELFRLLETEMAPKINKQAGRPGMTLWSIFVCGVLRLDLNIDYDRLHELVNQHNTLRQMLGHAPFDPHTYHYQTLKDNVILFTPDLLDKINQLVVTAGHHLVKKKAGEALRGRCDSFVVETNVHYPTDISLLFDATRKVIELCARLATDQGWSDWRQHAYNVRDLKRHLRSAQNAKRSKARDDAQQAKNDARVIEAHQAYLALAQKDLDRAVVTLAKAATCSGADGVRYVAARSEIETYIRHAVRQIGQTRGREMEKQSDDLVAVSVFNLSK